MALLFIGVAVILTKVFGAVLAEIYAVLKTGALMLRKNRLLNFACLYGGYTMGNLLKDFSGIRKDRQSKHHRKSKEAQVNWKQEILSWIWILVIAGVGAFILDTYIVANGFIPTGSMENTIMPKSRVIGSRLSYKFGGPKRGDIAIFTFPDDKAKGITTYYVKRIIGLPEETVDIIDGKIYINGSDIPLKEPYLKEPMKMKGENHLHYEIPKGCYFMLGDNRNNSKDSRFWKYKYVPENDLLAKVYLEYFPAPQFLH